MCVNGSGCPDLPLVQYPRLRRSLPSLSAWFSWQCVIFQRHSYGTMGPCRDVEKTLQPLTLTNTGGF